MSKIKTVNLQGDVTTVDLGRKFAYVECNNLSESEILLSESPNFERGDDGVIIINAGSTATIGDLGTPQIQTIYLKGSGEVQIVGKGYALSSFKIAGKGGGGNGKAKQLILLKSTTESSEKLNGLTGFELINTLPSGLWGIGEWGGIYGVAFTSVSTVLEKANSLYGSGSIDSALFATLNEFNLTDYNYILIDFYSASNYTTGKLTNFGGSYFRLDEPTNFPQSTVAYDWSEWDAMGTENCQQGLFVKDISQIEGSHKLYFGIHHGTYSNSYSNALALLNIILF